MDMVSRITIFEPHFEGVQIGPELLGSGKSTQSPSQETNSASGGRSLSRRVATLLIVSFVMFVGYRALGRAREEPISFVESAEKIVQERVSA